MDAMVGFYNMSMPQMLGINEKAWFSCCDEVNSPTSNKYYYLLNDGSNLLGDLKTATFDELEEFFFFESEIECHRELYAYYLQHGVDYPHIGRYNELINEKTKEEYLHDNGGNIVVSEVMEFI